MSVLLFSGEIDATTRLAQPAMVLVGIVRPAKIVFPRQPLKQIVAGLMGIDCFYAEESAEFGSPVTFAQATLRIRPSHEYGVDEFRFYTTNTYQQTSLACLRSFVLSVTVESYLQATSFADDYLEVLRTRLRWNSSRAALHGLNVALETFDDIQRLPTSYDTRVISAANLDIHFAWAFNDVTDDTGWVETINGTNAVPGILLP